MTVKIFEAFKILKAIQLNDSYAFIAANRLLGFDPSDGTAKLEFDIGDLTVIANGSLVGDALVREGNALEVYNSSGVLIKSQNWEDLAGASNLTGFILPFASDVVPAGFLECDGALINRITFASLFAVIGVRFGIGDGSTTFNIPDLRGEHIRGFDNGRGADPDAGSRTDSGDGTTGDNVGTKQATRTQDHKHALPIHSDTVNNVAHNPGSPPYGTSAVSFTRTRTSTSFGSGGSTVAWLSRDVLEVLSEESRGRNVSMMDCIKF